MSIRTSLVISTLVLGMIIAGFANDYYKNTLDKEKQFHYAKDTSQVIEQLLMAASQWAVERGITHSALNAENILSFVLSHNIKERRERGNKAFLIALEGLQHIHLENKDQLIADMNSKFDHVEVLRAKVDNDVKVEFAQRNANLRDNWFYDMSDLIVLSQNLRYLLTQSTIQADVELGRQAQLKHFSWLMSEYAGRERAILGGVISANKGINANQLQLLSNYRGRVENGWDIVQKLAYNSTPQVMRTLDSTQNLFFGPFQQLRESIYQAVLNNKPLPVDTQEWIARSTEAIDTILDTQVASAAQTVETTNILLHQVKQQKMMSICIAILSLLIVNVVFFLVVFKLSGSARGS